MKRAIALALLFFIPSELFSQIFPAEGSKLNYRLIGFSPQKDKANGAYTLEISRGSCNDDATFKKKLIRSVVCKNERVIAEVPSWGADYTWRAVYAGKQPTKSRFHHFSTLRSPNVDPDSVRLRIIDKAEQYQNAYVFVDESHALYDMNGNAVWFLPDVGSKMSPNSAVRDMKLTLQGTITFMVHLADNDDIYEINYDGAVLWERQDVSGSSPEKFHHEFTRLGNGHYMALGNQSAFWKVPGYREINAQESRHFGIERDSNNVYRQKMDFGTLMEYDEKGNVVWSWKSADYFQNSDFADKKIAEGVYDMMGAHENSFFFDERDSIIYVGCRNISRIIKLKYPEGIVLAAYGNKYVSGMENMGNEMFCGQHSVKRSRSGDLILFNNNSLPGEDFAKVELLAEPLSPKDPLKKIWEYQCTTDGMNGYEMNVYNTYMGQMRNLSQKAIRKNTKVTSSSGGNVVELSEEDFFVSTCGPVSKMFIVNMEKKILWSAILEVYKPAIANWTGKTIYRASILASQKDIERLIWHEDTAKK